jgi:hypothetical protein
MNILIYGPSVEAVGLAKREAMRKRLSEYFTGADIRLGEDGELTNLPKGGESLRLQERELWHLWACDVCVVLDASKGAGEEIAYFTRTPLAHKLFILTDERYRGATTFPAALRRHQNQEFYTAEEYVSCNLIQRVLVRVKQVALGKLLELVT